MKVHHVLAVAGAAFLAGVLVGADTRRVGGVVSLDEAPVRVAPPGTARVRILSQPGAQAFVGVLDLDAGAKVPTHRDESDELIYVLDGGGTLTMDGRAYRVSPGDLVTMPSGAEVRFDADTTTPTRVLQVFAPAASAAKYEAWKPAGP